jgi:hypothetical protein
MKFEITDDHIGVFDNFFPDDLLDMYIKHFEYCVEFGLTFHRNEQRYRDEGISVPMFHPDYPKDVERNIKDVSQPFVEIFWRDCYSKYVDKYEILSRYERCEISSIKIQKTLPGEGYHVWHCESATRNSSDRFIAFGLYLNTVEEGGETEFLHQHKRFAPIRNRLLIWPAQFTHTHRGNPPLKGEKYLLTGWVGF